MRQSEYILKVLTALAAAGWHRVWRDGTAHTINPEKLASAIGEFETATINLRRDGQDSFVLFVWQGPDETYGTGQGETADEVLADFDMNVDPVISKIL